MRSIESYFTSNPERELFDYTGISSLMGIVNTRQLWASNIAYLNDSSEYFKAVQVANKVLEPILDFDTRPIQIIQQEMGPFQPVKRHQHYDFLLKFYNWINPITAFFPGIYIFSLSEKPSLLSQWRSYTPHGKGVSIGFSPSKLAIIAQTSGFKIAKCLYTPEDHEELIHSLIDFLATAYYKKPDLIASYEYYFIDFIEDYRNFIYQVLSIIKDGSFEEEVEWRLISPPIQADRTENVKFREGASMLIPYIEINLDCVSPPYFETVTLGPSSDPILSLRAIVNYLSTSRNFCGQFVTCGIPYREWK